MPEGKPAVRGILTLEEDLDLTASLDGWTLAELEAFIVEKDDAGLDVLMSDSYVVARDFERLDYAAKDLLAYVQWRKENGHEGRMT